MYSVTDATLLLIYPFLGSSILTLAVLSLSLINRGRGPLSFLSATHSSLVLPLDDPALERRRHLRTSPLLRHWPLHQPVRTRVPQRPSAASAVAVSPFPFFPRSIRVSLLFTVLEVHQSF